MPEREVESVLEIKDALLMVPVIASSVAISWAIGRFIPFGGFGYFSLSDHLLSATSALPVALMAVAYFGLGFFILAKIVPRAAFRLLLESGNHTKLLVFALVLVTLIAVLGGLKVRTGDLPPLFVLVLSALAIVPIVNVFWLHYPVVGNASLLFIFGSSVAATMAIAADLSFSDMNLANQKNDFVLSDIVTQNGTTSAFIIMGGDHGLNSSAPLGVNFT
jgi:hypothetical protein